MAAPPRTPKGAGALGVVSAKSIKLYESHRSAKTLPPPRPGDVTADELDETANEIRKQASRLLARANDLNELADRLRGLPQGSKR